MKATRTSCYACFSGLLFFALLAAAQTSGTLLHAADASKLVPDAVYFAGKSATTQARNSAGIHLGEHYVLASLVDTSGYSSSVQERYQGYLLTEVPLSFSGHALPPGAYGVGFVAGHFLVMDIGDHTLLQVPSHHDAQMQRPMPLQILAGSAAGKYRLCFGRDCVDFGAK
jgi:hypothetical protein